MKEMHVAAFNTQERHVLLNLIKDRMLDPQEGDDPELLQGCAEMFMRAMRFGDMREVVHDG